MNDLEADSPSSSAITERHVVINGIHTRTLEVDGAGPPLLLLHGFSDSADSYRPLLRELARRSRRAIAVDFPGSGRAEHTSPATLSSLDEFTAAFVRAYAGDGHVILVGNSLGGLSALRAAIAGGLPLTAVAGLGPAGLAYHRELSVATRYLGHVNQYLGWLDRLPVPGTVVRCSARTLYSNRLGRGRAEPELAQRYASHLGTMRDWGRMRRDLVSLTGENSLIGDADLPKITVPTLLIWGERDRLADIDGAARLLAAVPHSRLARLEDCGHCPQIEVPAEVAELLLGLSTSAEQAAGYDPEARS